MTSAGSSQPNPQEAMPAVFAGPLPDSADTVWPPRPTSGPPPVIRPPFRSARTLGIAARSILAVQLLLACLSAALDGRLAAGTTVGPIAKLNDADFGLILCGMGLFVPGAVLIILWLFQAYRNIAPLGNPAPRVSAGWMAASFFVPIWNLYYPHAAMQLVWKGSELGAPIDDPKWIKRRGTILVTGWWVFFLLDPTLFFLLIYLANTLPIRSASTPFVMLAACGLFLVASSICLIEATRRIDARQLARNREVIERAAKGAAS